MRGKKGITGSNAGHIPEIYQSQALKMSFSCRDYFHERELCGETGQRDGRQRENILPTKNPHMLRAVKETNIV